MANHTQTKMIGGDSIVCFFEFQVERETVMTHINNVLGVILLKYANSLLIVNIDLKLKDDRALLFKV